MAERAKRMLQEIEYTCKCGHKQIVRYFPEDSILPATCCVECRAGFDNPMGYGQMAVSGVGMIATKKQTVAA